MVDNTHKWGRAKARERYGEQPSAAMRVPVRNKPQALGDPETNLQDMPLYDNIHRDDWIRGKGESAEGKPDFDRSKG